MIESYSLTDKMAGKSLGCFVAGYNPTRGARFAVSSVPLVLLMCSGFLSINTPASGGRQPAPEALVMAFSRIDASESIGPEPAEQLDAEADPVLTEAEQQEARPAEPEGVAVEPEAVALAEVAEQPVEVTETIEPGETMDPVETVETVEFAEPVETAPLLEPEYTEVDREPGAAAEAVAEQLATPRPPRKPVKEPEAEKASSAEALPTEASVPERVKADTIATEALAQQETAVAKSQIAALPEPSDDDAANRLVSETGPSEPIVITNPEFLEPPDPPVYPPTSLKRHEQGTVVVRALVSGAGAAREVKIWQSSGFRRLDRAAEVAVRDWQFAPAVRLGLPTAAWVEVPVHFQLN